MNYFYNDPSSFYLHRQENKSRIKKLGLLVGGAFLLYVVLQNLLYIIFDFAGLTELYSSDPVYQSAVDIVLICISLPLPFYILGKRMKKISLVAEPLNLDKPYSAAKTGLAVVAGVGLCMLSNIITSFITVFMEAFNLHLKSPDVEMPTGTAGIIISVVRLVICAAMTEEIVMRGYVMGNLRAYGDKFAIIMSSVMFAAMHGNLVQAPFALIAGFALGYFSIKTGSLWTGIIIHALNNTISVVITYATEGLSEEKANMLAAILIYGLIFVGALAFILFRMITKDRPLTDNCRALSLKEKCSAFILNPTMLLSFAYMLYITSFYIEIG